MKDRIRRLANHAEERFRPEPEAASALRRVRAKFNPPLRCLSVLLDRLARTLRREKAKRRRAEIRQAFPSSLVSAGSGPTAYRYAYFGKPIAEIRAASLSEADDLFASATGISPFGELG